MRLYAEDLAHIHDAGFSDFARRAAPAILELLSAAGVHTGLIVELRCGGGVLARALRRAGYDVLGVDVSAALIAESTREPTRRTLTRRITTFRRVNGLYRRGAETHVLRLYRGTELAARLRALGFRVRLRRGYGDLRLEPNRIAIIARKLER